MSAPPEPEWMKPVGRPWRVRGERLVYDNPWISLVDYDAEAPTGARAPHYGVVGFKNLAVGVLPLHEDGTITLVGQHRFPTREYSWELPEGGVPHGENPLAGARRELAEEAGLRAAEWRQVLVYQTSNSTTDERGLGYIATNLSPASAEPDDTESLAVARVAFRDALEQGLAGRIQDMITLALLLRAYHMAREGELEEPLARAMLGQAGETP